MSIISEALAPCSKCGQQHKVTVYRSINISENPELKDKVRDGSLFLWECPHCGQVNLAKYETLYHDPAKKLMVWLIPAGETKCRKEYKSCSLPPMKSFPIWFESTLAWSNQS